MGPIGWRADGSSQTDGRGPITEQTDGRGFLREFELENGRTNADGRGRRTDGRTTFNGVIRGSGSPSRTAVLAGRARMEADGRVSN